MDTGYDFESKEELIAFLEDLWDNQDESEIEIKDYNSGLHSIGMDLKHIYMQNEDRMNKISHENKKLKISSLIATQQYVDIDNLLQILKGKPENGRPTISGLDYPAVWLYLGKYILADGYHRTWIADSLGKDSLDYTVLDIDSYLDQPI